VRGNFYSMNLVGIVVSPPEYRDLEASPLFETVGVYYASSAALQRERAERVPFRLRDRQVLHRAWRAVSPRGPDASGLPSRSVVTSE